MSTKSLMDCEKEVLLKHPRFIRSPQGEIEDVDITSLTSLALVNNIAYGSIKELFDKHSYDTIVTTKNGLLYAQPLALGTSKNLTIAHELSGLPYRALCETYSAGNETETVEIEDGKLDSGNKVLIVSTMLATRQKTAALIRLVQRTGAKIVGVAALLNLGYLTRAEISEDIPVRAVLHYDESPQV